MKLAARLLPAALGLAILTSCTPDPINETHQGTLSAGDSTHPRDGSFYDEYTFRAAAGSAITINMTSSEVDTYLQLRRSGYSDDEYIQENDDSTPGSTDSQIVTTAPGGGTYTVWANTYDAGDTGTYTLTITTEAAK